MTLKYFCDRCNRICDDDVIDIKIMGKKVCSPKKMLSGRTTTDDYSIDMCRNCYKYFQKFMKFMKTSKQNQDN